MAPGSELRTAGISPIGRTSYERANGEVQEYPFGLAQIEFMGEVTAGRVIFGPEGTDPILGVTALESVGITIDPANRTLKRLSGDPSEVSPGANERVHSSPGNPSGVLG
jgi:predicted aspartyl protease